MSMRQIKIGHRKSRCQAGTESDLFTVISTRNSVQYLPGQVLDRAEVERLCCNNGWEVTVVPLNEGGGR